MCRLIFIAPIVIILWCSRRSCWDSAIVVVNVTDYTLSAGIQMLRARRKIGVAIERCEGLPDKIRTNVKNSAATCSL